MKIIPIVPGVFLISLGFVNAFLIDRGELTLIDTGTPGSTPVLLDAIRAAGCQPEDLKHILISHLHVDHAGSAKALQDAMGARVHMHPADARALADGKTMRAVEPGPGLLNRVIVSVMKRGPAGQPVDAPRVDYVLEDNQVLDFAGGLRVIYAPGHTAGHIVFLLPVDGGVLFASDACSHMLRLGPSILYESYEEGRRTLARLAELPFSVALFSHGKPMQNAAKKFRVTWG